MVRALKEVHPHRRRVFPVTDGIAGRLIERVPVVAVAEATLNVYAHVVVHVAAQIAVDPLGKIRVSQGLRALVDQHVVIKLHVVHLIVGREGEGLRADFHPNRLTLRFRVDVALVIENPVVRLVPIQRDLVFAAALGAIDFLEEIVPRIVARGWVVESVPVVILKRREVVVLVEAHVTVRGVFEEVRGNRVAVGELLLEVTIRIGDAIEVLAVAHSICPLGDGESVVLLTRRGVHFRRTGVGQRPRPEIVSDVPVAHSGQLELLIGADPAQPQRSAIHHRDSLLFRNHEGSLVDGAVVPQRSGVFDEGAHVVPFQVPKGRRGSAGFCTDFQRCIGLRLRHWESLLEQRHIWGGMLGQQDATEQGATSEQAGFFHRIRLGIAS